MPIYACYELLGSPRWPGKGPITAAPSLECTPGVQQERASYSVGRHKRLGAMHTEGKAPRHVPIGTLARVTEMGHPRDPKLACIMHSLHDAGQPVGTVCRATPWDGGCDIYSYAAYSTYCMACIRMHDAEALQQLLPVTSRPQKHWGHGGSDKSEFNFWE